MGTARKNRLLQLPDRALQPPSVDVEKHPTIFHYCSLDSFLKILSTRTLWLSDINTLNDYSEVHWSYERFIAAANAAMPDVGEEFVDRLDSIVSAAQLQTLPLICSLSKAGDVLSQWRSYASDGEGVAIGFHSKAFVERDVRCTDVQYDTDFQLKFFQRQITDLKAAVDACPINYRDELVEQRGILLGLDLACFKNPAFAEEQEVRIVRVARVEKEANNWFLFNDISNDQSKRKNLPPIKFRAKRNGLVAYTELSIEPAPRSPIAEIVVGPKCLCNGIEISMALNAAGFRDVVVRRSTATYR